MPSRICGECFGRIPRHRPGCPRDPVAWLERLLPSLEPVDRRRLYDALPAEILNELARRRNARGFQLRRSA
jgi:hypothetical protein